MPSAELLIYEVRDHVAIMTMNNPERRNALGSDLVAAMIAGFQRFRDDGDAWVGILTGTGRAFCAGGDLKDMKSGSANDGDWAKSIDYLMPLYHLMEAIDKPVIAAVNGFAMGGGFSLAHFCSLIVMAESAKLGMPEVAVGVPNFSYFDVWKTIGVRRTLELSLTGDAIGADYALQIGLINRIAPDDQLIETAMELAGRITKNAPLAVAGAHAGIKFTLHNPREQWADVAPKIWQQVLASDDLREGLDAFAEKRKPEWQNR